MRKYSLLGVLLLVGVLLAVQFSLFRSNRPASSPDSRTAARLTPPSIPVRTIVKTQESSSQPTATLSTVFALPVDSQPLQKAEAYLRSPVGAEVTACAVLQVGDRWLTMQSDAYGQFDRVVMSENQTIPIAAVFPKSEPGDKVAVSAEDGGKIDSDEKVRVLTLDEQRRVAFHFSTTNNGGVYRVTLRNREGLQTMNFWVGPEWVYRTNVTKKTKTKP